MIRAGYWNTNMNKILALFLISVFTLAFLGRPVDAGWNPRKHAKQMRQAKQTIRRFLRKDPGMKIFFNRAYAYVVFPTVGKGGMFIGGAYGKGKVFRRGRWIGSMVNSPVWIV